MPVDDLAGVDADARLDAELGQRVAHLERLRGTARRASSSCTPGTPKTAITASPMNFSTVPPWRSTIALHALEVAREQRAQRLWVESLAERRRAGDVAEEDGDGLALLAGGAAPRRAASRTRSQNFAVSLFSCPQLGQAATARG